MYSRADPPVRGHNSWWMKQTRTELPIGREAVEADCSVMSRSTGSRNRFLGDRFFDDHGAEWVLEDRDLSRTRIADLLGTAGVRVAVHTSRSSLRWIDPAARLTIWKAEIEPNFHDRKDYRPPPNAPGQLPFHGTLWKRDGQVLLIFDDFD